MTDKEESLLSAFTPSLMFEYVNTYTNKKNVTYSEFKGFTRLNSTEYILVLNFTDCYDKESDSYDINMDFVDLQHFKLFLLKKRFEQ